MPTLRTVTLLGLTGIVGAVVTGLLAGCGGGAVQVTTVRDGPGPSPTRSSGPTGTPSGSGMPATPTPTETRTAAELLQQARAAFAGASSVHVTGTAVRGADAYVLDVRLAGSAGGTGTIKTSGQTVQVIRIGDVAYVGGDLAFWRSVTGDETRAQQMVGSYVRTGADDPNFASFVAFTRPETYAQVLPDPAQPATLGPATTIRGAPAIGVRDGAGSTVYVATTGPAYPLRLDGLTSGQVVFLDFAEYGAPVDLVAPAPRTVHGPGGGS